MIQVACAATGETIECKETAKGNPKLSRGRKWRGDKAYSAENAESKSSSISIDDAISRG
jgi:hypothetical protein